jgi:hypothetical protein
MLWVSQSHITTDGQSVLVSSPFWDSWPDFSVLYMTISVFVLLGRPLWREGGSVICRSLCRVRIFTLLLLFTVLYTLYNIIYVQYVQGLCQSRLCEADYALSYFLLWGPPIQWVPMGTGDPFPGVKRWRGVTMITHLHLVPRSRMCRSYIPLPLGAYIVVAG